MPVISVFFGITIIMYWRDHAPPHVHAFYGGAQALFEIETGNIITGSLRLAVARMVRDWIETHRKALRANWERGRLREPFEKIPGADEE